MGSSEEAEQALVERARRGDRDAQRQLWHGHRRWVAAIVLAHRPRAIEVEDLMQEVAVKLLDKVETLRDPGAFRPWLRQIVINVCRGAARQHRPTLSLAASEPRHGETLGGAAPAPASAEHGPVQRSAERDAAARVYEHAMGLPPEYREPLLLRCMRGMTYREISDVLDLPVTTIETRLARARRMIRTELDAVLAEDAEDAPT